MRTIQSCLLTLAALALISHPARADVASATAAAFSAKTVAERTTARGELETASPADPSATYALGAIRFFEALERLAVALHRHGFDTPRTFLLPLFRLPVPENPAPEPLDYDGLRAILTEFEASLAEAAATLASVPADATIAIDVGMAALGVDLDGDGAIAPADESLAAIMAQMAGPDPAADAVAGLSFRFDRADGFWLQGYANFLMAQADFWLAHDFRETFDGSFHMLFPRARLPLQEALVPPDDGLSGGMLSSEWRIADIISLIHLIDWPVAEPRRRADARRHLLEMIRLSRETWAAIDAETDKREWLPGPKQKGIHPLTGLEVGKEQVAGWREALTLAEDVLEGRSLIPHFRFAARGIDMKRFFDQPQPFDLVLTITGPGAVPTSRRGVSSPARSSKRSAAGSATRA